MKEIKITDAVLEDASDIDKLVYKVRLESYPNKELSITRNDIKNHFSKKYFSENLDFFKNTSKKIIIAKNKNKIVGVCFVEKTEETNILRTIHVLGKFHGLGIGKRLWENSQSFLDKKKNIEVVVALYNNPAIKFYEKLGFVDTGERYTGKDRKMRSGSVMTGVKMVLNNK